MANNTAKQIYNEVYCSLLEDYKNGIVHCGKNGPYDDPETIVRNLCNLIIASCSYILAENDTPDLQPIIKHMSSDLLSFEDNDGLYIIRNKKNNKKPPGFRGLFR